MIISATEKTAKAGQAAMDKKGYDCKSFVADVTNPDAMTHLADEIAADYGRIDVLVANAGVSMAGARIEDVSDNLWRRVNDINYNGVFWCNRASGRQMLAAGHGAIVNMGSISGLIINRPQFQTYYNASKAAVHHLTRGIAAEWATLGVRVNCIAPTYIDTPMLQFAYDTLGLTEAWLAETPMNRFGKPEEIAAVVHFLASDASSLLTGTVITADGGYTV